MSSTLTKDSPFPARLLAWVNERFPFANATLFFVLYVTAVSTGQFATSEGPIDVGIPELLGFFPAWAFFLMLRVFDEHKDYEEDMVNYPDRVLQSGLITLGHLKVVGAIAIAVQFFGSMWLDSGFGPVTIWWLAVMAYASLMGKEFFVAEWLKDHFVLYAVSHMLIMPLALLWMAQIGAGEQPLPPTIGLLAGLAFLSGAAFEVTRKMRGPEEERENVDSYTKIMGTGGTPMFVLFLLVASAVVQVALLHWVFDGDIAWFWYVIVAIAVVLPAVTLFKFRSDPSAKLREVNEGTVALNMLLGYAVLTGAIASQYGVEWAA